MEAPGVTTDDLNARTARPEDGPDLISPSPSGDRALTVRIHEMAATLATVNRRVDTLTDAVVTLRGLVNERMADVGDAISRSQTQIIRDIEDAFDRDRGPSPHVEEVRQELHHGLSRFRTDVAKDLDEHRRAQEQAAADAGESLAATEQRVRRVDQVTTALATEIAVLGQRLSEEVGESTEAAKIVVRAGTERVSGDVKVLEDAVAGALAQIAVQLERVAAASGDQGSLLRALANSLEAVSGRVAAPADTDRHEELVASIEAIAARSAEPPLAPPELRALRTSLDRVEGLVEALVDAADEPAPPAVLDERINVALGRLERLGKSMTDRVSQTTSSAVEDLSAAAEQLRAAAPADRHGAVALTALEEQVAELVRQREDHERRSLKALGGMEETMAHLAEAQADDLERIMDRIDANAPSTVARPVDDERLERIESALAALSGRPDDAGPADPEVSQQLAVLGNQIDALRRRLAVRARPPAFAASTIQDLADAVAARLDDPNR